MSKGNFLSNKISSPQSKILKIFLSILLLIIPLLSQSALAAQIRLAWVAPTTNTDGTPLNDLAGYKIYYGTSPGTGTDPKSCGMCGYTTLVDVGNVTTYTVTSLTSGQTYYFAVTAYDTSGNESGFSNNGYYVLDGWGGIYAGGTAPPISVTAYWPGWDIARAIAFP